MGVSQYIELQLHVFLATGTVASLVLVDTMPPQVSFSRLVEQE